MTTKISLAQINTGTTANLVVSNLPAGTEFSAGDNITIEANGRISSTSTTAGSTGVSESYHPFLTIGI